MWDTSNETDRREGGRKDREDFPEPHFTRKKGTAEWGFSGVDRGQIKADLDQWIFLCPRAAGSR